MNVIDISIIIVAKNEESNIGSALDMVFRQKIDKGYEVIVIDSGSTDLTLEIVRRYPVRIVKIKPEEFGHAKTRNLGVNLSKGSYVVFLTADATPVNDSWLENLTLPFKQAFNIAGVYSRQVPRIDCYPIEGRGINIFSSAGLTTKVKSVDINDPYQIEEFNKNIWDFIAFSNVSAAYRKGLLEKYPFDETLPAVEDQEWVHRIIKNGHTILHEPNSCVYHSHNDTLKRLYQRHYLYGLSFKKFIKDKGRSSFYYFVRRTTYEIASDYLFLWRYELNPIEKNYWFFKSPLFRTVKNFAFYQGFR